jgi:4-amino-4-deoxy-L-arabinose transferase-like glycosyltransferase
MHDRYRFGSRVSLVFTLVAALAVCGLLFARLSAYGIWDPWELKIAEAARTLNEKHTFGLEPMQRLSTKLTALGFSWFGVREWTGRLPIACAGAALLGLTAAWVGIMAGARAGLYALIALGSTPMLLLHGRQMLGATPLFALSALVMTSASFAVHGPRLNDERADTRLRYIATALAVLASTTATWMSGALLSVVPPLGAVTLAWLLVGPEARASASSAQRWIATFIVAATFAVTFLVAHDVWGHYAEVSPWVGASPLDDEPPTYERTLTQVFHGFVPWSPLLPLALGALLKLGSLDSAPARLRLMIVLWTALAFAAHTLFISAYGNAVFPAPPALAAAAALWLCDVEDRPRSFWPETLIAGLFVGLAIRDFALYPESPLAPLALSNAKVPDVFNPKIAWAALLGFFALTIGVASAAVGARGALDLRAPYRGIAGAWRRGAGHKIWVVLLVLVCIGLLGFGVVAWIPASYVRLTSIGRRVGRIIGFVPLAIPLAIAAGQFAYALTARLVSFRIYLVLIASLAVGGYTSQVFLPRLSEHFSPRDVFATFNRYGKANEELAQYKVEGRAAAFYVRSKVQEIANRTALVAYLSEPGRKWAAFPADEFADVDVAFRRNSSRHLFVPAYDNARVMLVASEPVAGIADHNPIAKYVTKTPPKIEHPAPAVFEDRIELLGYNIQLPGKDHVGPGQKFAVTWIFRALKSNLGSYRIFMHVDGQEQRLNGDHEPVDGKYPVRLWDEGDVIIDRQELSVPATYRPGLYTLHIGFFRGESRLKVTEGAKDDANRVNAGTIRIN